jgi:hypothetical protein
VLREREVVRRREAVRGFAAAVERFAAGLLRDADAPDDLARVALLAAEVERLAVEPDLLDFARDVVLRFAVERRVAPRAGVAPETTDSTSAVHLPDITRCAASATASAMIEPNLVALDTMLVAAWEAVSAASSPASRILRRTTGLALIAAAAAASPAASISLLIAALASLSTVAFLELLLVLVLELEDDFADVLRAGLAIFYLPPMKRHFNAITVPE